MLRSAVVKTSIDRDYEEAYAILKQPGNFRLWSPVLESRFEARGNNGLDWLVDLPQGTAILRFSRPNEFGILDYTVLTEGGPSRTTAMRLVRNQDGCELVSLFLQQPGQSDAAFDSYVAWATNDLLALRNVVETLERAKSA